ncbi:hypothetical protein Tco_1029318 [Tanacetum coccineum]|uniref:Uncharacterized protein n=1 Tax=Tanacetum coccineum TaxID=301880 RepID=A0ABQ5G4U3_9ASTR
MSTKNADSEDLYDPSEDRDFKDIYDPIEYGDFEEHCMVNEKTNVDEASSVLVEEENSLPSEEDSDSLLSDRTTLLSCDNICDTCDADPFSGETENPNDYTRLKLEDMSHVDSKMMNDSECNGSPNMMGAFVHFNTENSSEMLELASLDNRILDKCCTGFLLKSMAPLLSYIIGMSSTNVIVDESLFIHSARWHAFPATYPTSVVDIARAVCFFENQDVK